MMFRAIVATALISMALSSCFCLADKETAKSEVDCAICKIVVNDVQSMLSNNMTEDQMTASLNNFCGKMLEIYQSECYSLVNILPLIISDLDNSENPQAVCSDLIMCTGDNPSKKTSEHQTEVHVPLTSI